MKIAASRISFLILLLLSLASSAWAADEPAPSEPHGQLKKILDQPIYNAWRLRQAGKLPDDHPALARLSDRIGKAWDAFWNWLFPEKKRSETPPNNNAGTDVFPIVLEGFAWAIAVVAVVFIAILLYKTLGGARQAPSAGQLLSRQRIQDAMDSGDALALGADQWLEQAQRLAKEQNFRAVYRALYLALLSGLHTAGKIDHSRNRTNWTYVQQYRGTAEERVIFGELTDLFDRVWYGREEETGRDFSQLQLTVASLAGAGGGA